MSNAKKNTPDMQPRRTVQVYLPPAEDSDGALKPDQTEQVILNGRVTSILRGERVEVKPEVFVQLRSRYPAL